MSLVVLDTDVASGLLRILDSSIPAVTFVTIGELTKWTLVRHWGPVRRDPLCTQMLRRFVASTGSTANTERTD